MCSGCCILRFIVGVRDESVWDESVRDESVWDEGVRDEGERDVFSVYVFNRGRFMWY